MTKSLGAAPLYLVAVCLVAFGFAMTVEADHPEAFPRRRDDDGAVGALLCLGMAALSAAAGVSLSRRLLSKAVCAAIVLVCVRPVVGVGVQR